MGLVERETKETKQIASNFEAPAVWGCSPSETLAYNIYISTPQW